MRFVIAMALMGVLISMPVVFAQEESEVREAPAAASPKEDVTTVRARGLGVDHDEALKDALRKACERGGHLEVFAQSATENYTLIHDTVLAQVTGLIKDYKILSEGEDPIGGYFVEIEARVDRRIIDATWGQVQILVKQMGKPKILVNFVEKITDMAYNPPVEKVEDASLLQSKIEELLTEKGFELVDKSHVERLKRDKIKQASLAGDTGALQQLAGELGAQMYLVGFSRASGPQITDAYGVRLYMWETDVTLKAFWSETGQILFSRSEVGTRGGSRTPGPPGAKQAIAKAGEKMAYACLQSILEKWSRQTVGGGKVVLEVKGLDFKRMLVLQAELQRIEGVREVNHEWHKPVAKYELVTVHSAEKFAEILTQVQFPGFSLDVEDQKFNTIAAKVESRSKRPVVKTPPQAPAAEKHVITVPAIPSGEKKFKPTSRPTSLPATVPTTTVSTKPATRPTTRPASTQPNTEM